MWCHVCSASTLTLQKDFQGCNSLLVAQVSDGAKDCGTRDTHGWQLSSLPSLIPGITMLEQEEGGKNRVKGEGRELLLWWITSPLKTGSTGEGGTGWPWQHRPMALWWSRAHLWCQMLGRKTRLHQLQVMLPYTSYLTWCKSSFTHLTNEYDNTISVLGIFMKIKWDDTQKAQCLAHKLSTEVINGWWWWWPVLRLRICYRWVSDEPWVPLFPQVKCTIHPPYTVQPVYNYTGGI